MVVCTNFTLTLLIAVKIIRSGRNLRAIVSEPPESSSGNLRERLRWELATFRRVLGSFTGVLAVLIESSLPLTLLGVAAAVHNACATEMHEVTQSMFWAASVSIFYSVLSGLAEDFRTE